MVRATTLLPGRIEAQAHKLATVARRDGFRNFTVDVRNGAVTSFAIMYGRQWRHFQFIEGELCEFAEVD